MTATVTALPRTTLDVLMHIGETQSFIAGVKAVVVGASTDYARPVLTNVQVRIKDSHIKLIATNSYLLTVVTLGPYPEMDANAEAEFMVDAKQLVAALPKGRNCMLQLEIDLENNQLALVNVGEGTHSVVKHYTEGTFPNWEALIRNEAASTPFEVGFNPKFVAAIAKAGDTFRKGVSDAVPLRFRSGATEMKPVYFEMNVIDRGTFFALLMPVRLT